MNEVAVIYSEINGPK